MTVSKVVSSRVDPTLHSPRILCLHGRGANALVFRLQARALVAGLSPTFRLVFVDGPFLCDPSPDILPVFEDFGPYHRWLQPSHHQDIDANLVIDKIWFQLRAAMDKDTAQGADGPWVGLLGFSQGAKLSASLLFDQQVRVEVAQRGDIKALMKPMTTWKFGVLMAGSAPPVALSEYGAENKYLVNAAEAREGKETVPLMDDAEEEAQGHKLHIPTIHVHGLKDSGINLHRQLLNQMDKDAVTLVEWDGNHRLPIKHADVEKVVVATMNVARKTGAIS